MRTARRACQHGLSERQARRALAPTSTQAPRARAVDAAAAVSELLAYLDVAVSDYAVLADSTGNDAVKVAALKARDEAVVRRFEAWQTLGLLPTSFRGERARLTMAVLLEEWAELLREHDIRGAALDAFRDLAQRARDNVDDRLVLAA